MASESYKLSTTIVGHTSDVRCVAYSKEPPGLVTVSRDKTARFWQLGPDQREYNMVASFTGHTQFINTVVVIPPCKRFPSGIILTGGMDGVIRGFSYAGGDPEFLLTGHEKAVTCLNHSSDGTILSGSWDFTVRVWQNGACVKTLTEHSLAVWDVAAMPDDQIFVSASADKSIKLYDGTTWALLRTLLGHESVVRCVKPISRTEIISGANDATLRRWNIVDGSCLAVLPAHDPFTYSISLWPNGDYATCGEDRVLKIWKDSRVVQNVPLPTLTNWSVVCLPNGDAVVGSNDGTVRVFSKAIERQAPTPEQKMYEQILSEVKIQAPELEGLRTEQMPGVEALQTPGDRDGQTRLVKENGNVTVYSWAAAESKWMLVGSVVGTKKDTKMYNGREYDYLFDVDLGDEHPKLKLGYNKGEDPWVAAQRFIHDHRLSQEFIDQIANFIISNSKEVAHLYPSAAAADPFTGENRYVPGSGVPGGLGVSMGGGADPFTGASGYRPGVGAAGLGSSGSTGDPLTGTNKYIPAGSKPSQLSESVAAAGASGDFPIKDYLAFSQGNRKAMSDKLMAFLTEQGGDGAGVAAVMRLVDSSDGSSALTDHEFGTGTHALLTMLSWPEDKLLPVLDALRLVVRQKRVNQHLCETDPGALLRLFDKYVMSKEKLESSAERTNRMLTLRTACNLFQHETGRSRLAAIWEPFNSALPSLLPADKNTQIAIGTLLLNCSVYVSLKADSEQKDEATLQTMQCTLDVLASLEDAEAVYRALVGLGTLLHGSDMISIASDFGVKDGLRRFAGDGVQDYPPKVVECSQKILAML